MAFYNERIYRQAEALTGDLPAFLPCTPRDAHIVVEARQRKSHSLTVSPTLLLPTICEEVEIDCTHQEISENTQSQVHNNRHCATGGKHRNQTGLI